MHRLLCMCVLFAGFAGCMVGPDYRKPDIDVPGSFTYAPWVASETANTQWWKQFGDPVLEGLIAEALAKNSSVKIAAANVEQAAGLLMTTRSELSPQAGYSGAGARQHLSGSTVSPAPRTNPYSSFQVLGGASWEIDLWGRIRRLTEAARAGVFASEEARRGVILSLVAQVASAHIQLCALDEQLTIAQRSLAAYGESVKLFEVQNRYGQVSGMNVEQARTQYETAAAAIPQIETQIVQTENVLSLLLGRNPGPMPRGKPLSGLAMPEIPSGLPSQLLERRPDIAQAEQNLVAANARIGAAKALYFPSISLTGSRGASSEELSDLFKGPSGTWTYSGSITGPIFTAGNIAGQVKLAEAGQQAALAAYEQAVRSAFADMENALASCRMLEDQLSAEKRRVDAYKEYARLALLQYNGGYAPYLTVLYAEAQLFPAELNEVQTRAATFTALINIYKAMGGGWVTEAEKLAAPKDKQDEKKQDN